MNLPDWAAALLDRPIGHLATADADGVPSVVPICFSVEGDVVWSVIDEKPKSTRALKRLRNLAENPGFSLVVDRYDEDWSRLAWVILHGRAAVVPVSQQPHALDLLRAKYPQYQEMNLEDSLLLRMEVRTAVSWRASP